jgi:uncharacterized membrane protein
MLLADNTAAGPGPPELTAKVAVCCSGSQADITNQPRKRINSIMNVKNMTIAVAIGSLLAVCAASAGTSDGAADGKVKCYGVAKAGKNDCATASHSCAGSAKKDNDPTEWKHMPKEECEKAGGKVGDDKKAM